jgi:predicted TPR repeat methyltransferase
LIIAADVLIYLGDPAPLFEKLRNVLERQAIFVLSTENCDKGDYHIRQTGRYAHNHVFMESVARRMGFESLLRESAGLRKEKEKWVDGDIFVFKYLN